MNQRWVGQQRSKSPSYGCIPLAWIAASLFCCQQNAH